MKKRLPEGAILIPEQADMVFDGIIYQVYQWPQQLFDGTTKTFEMLRRPDTVIGICIVGDRIIVLDDTQPHSGSRKSFPGGRVDDEDKSLLDAVRREVHEETGYTFNQWRLVDVHESPLAKIEWFGHIFVAWDVAAREEPHVDAGERIEVNLLTFEEVESLSAQQVGYISEAHDILVRAGDIQGLIALPEFKGMEFER